MPSTNITITHRHVRVNVRDSIRAGNDDLGRNEEVRRGHSHFPARDRARTEDGRNDTVSNENRTRSWYRHVPLRSPSGTRYDSHSPGQTESSFHTPSRQPPSREQNDQRRQSSYRLERYENIVYTTSGQSDQSRQSSYRLERYENIVYTTSRQASPEEQSDQTTHFSHRTKWSENTTNTLRQASPREPTHQTRNFSHRTGRNDHTPHHHYPRQAPAPSREKPHQSESSFNPHTSTSSTPPPVAPRGGDLYKILNVSPEASHAEIVSAARRRRIEVHPDRLQYPGITLSALDEIDDEAQTVGLAADTLCDEVSRRRYDRAVRRGSRS